MVPPSIRRSPGASPARVRRMLLASPLLALIGPGRVRADPRLAEFASGAAGAQVLRHDDFDTLLATYVEPSPNGINRVNYRGWAASNGDRRRLARYIGSLAATNPISLTRPEQFAFWANLYNAMTLQVVLDAYPVASIRQIKPWAFAFGPWKKPLVEVRGQRLSLDDIEQGILRAGWREPRVHYALNCGSIGCPNLRRRAFGGGALDQELTDAARSYVNHPRGARLQDGGFVVSSIYGWYQRDFGGSEDGVLRHLATYARPPLTGELAKSHRILGYQYDWALNDLEQRP